MQNNNKKVGVGVGIMILKEDKILLGKRHNDPNKADSELHGEGTWTMPGGKIEFGEEIENACKRETEEETGLKIDRDKLKLISISNDKVTDAHFVTIGFLCENFDGEPKAMEPDEITEWKWFPLSDLPRNIFFPSRNIVNNYTNQTIFQPESLL